LIVHWLCFSYYSTFNKEQWKNTAIYIQEREESEDLILINAPWLELNFKYYYKGNNTINGVQTTNQLNQTFKTNQHNNLWLILSHDKIADPNAQIKKQLDNTYQLNWQNEFISQDLINNISILGQPIISDNSIKITICYYSK